MRMEEYINKFTIKLGELATLAEDFERNLPKIFGDNWCDGSAGSPFSQLRLCQTNDVKPTRFRDGNHTILRSGGNLKIYCLPGSAESPTAPIATLPIKVLFAEADSRPLCQETSTSTPYVIIDAHKDILAFFEIYTGKSAPSQTLGH